MSPAVADGPYTDASLARLALSMAARELADFARAFVPISGDHGEQPVEDAARLRAAADSVLRLAVIFERQTGTSWEDIGVSLGVTKQSAHERYADAERSWRDALDKPEGVNEFGQRYDRLPAGAEDPDRWAARLDEWVRRHREPTDVDHGDHPVSGGLRRMDTHTEHLRLSGKFRALLDEHLAPPPEQLLPLYERQAVLEDRLAAENNDPKWREHAARTRARIAELRAQLDQAAGAGPQSVEDTGLPDVAIRSSQGVMSGDTTRHRAERVAGGPVWRVTWLPGRRLTRDQAVTAMALAEVVAAEDLHAGNRWWPQIDAWAGELGLAGPDAVVRASEPQP